MKFIVLTFSMIIGTTAFAFDISLDGVEFGKLEIGNDVFQSLGTVIPGRTILNNAEVILNDGDVLQVLRFSHGATVLSTSDFSNVGGGIGDYYFYSISENTTTYEDAVGTYIVGPSTIRLGYEKYGSSSYYNTFSSNEEYFCLLDYAILRAGDSSQSSISYTQEQYDAALTTGFNLGVQSVSTSEPVTEPPEEPATEPPEEPATTELSSDYVPDSLSGLIEVYSQTDSNSSSETPNIFTDAIYYTTDTVLQFSDGSSITSQTYSWDKDSQTITVSDDINGDYTVVYEFFETSNTSIYIHNFKVYNVSSDGDGGTDLIWEGFGFMYNADGDLNQNTVSDKEEWIGQSYTTATNFDNFLTDKTTITSSQLPETLPQLRTLNMYSLNDISDLRPGSSMIEVQNGTATLSMDIEKSSDLTSWATDRTVTIDIPIDEGSGTQFFRFKMTE